MNTTPRLNWEGRDVRVTNYGCGLQGRKNDEAAFWQSLATVSGRRSDPLQLTDVRSLASDIRWTWPT